MMSDEKAIFESAIEIPDERQRDEYLREACTGDSELCARVKKLLAFYDEDLPFLSETKLLADRPSFTDSLIGQKIDRYTIVKELGEGGFGVVYLAEQLVPIRRQVALKIVKPGMDTREILARFDAERQALAMMNHPHIAKMLDGGATADGRPYFVMEAVDGLPITDYCDKNRLGTVARLQLVAEVGRAVQHAHQKGIIHRDIKPTNILVSRDGEADVPHVIDFGVSKSIGLHLSDHTHVTRHGQVIGTPHYMSPEQAEQSEQNVDTRSDIYSLGVLLYELLTGQTPYDGERLKQAAFDELLRIIREEEPPTPSSRISTTQAAAANTAELRSTNVAQLGKTLRGELDWIVMKAIEKNPSRRFETVSELVADIARYLNNESVHSGPPSNSYRFRKFIRRNRGITAAVATVTAALAIGFVVAVLGLSRAQTERNNAVASASEARAVLDMLSRMLSMDPVAGRGRDLTVSVMLDDFAKSLPDLSGQPRIAAEIHGILGKAYERLDYLDKGLFHYTIEFELKRELFGPKHKEVAIVAAQLSHTYHKNEDLDKALEFGEIALPIFEGLQDDSQKSVVFYSHFSKVLVYKGQAERAERILQHAIIIAESLEPTVHGINLQAQVGICLCRMGWTEAGIEKARESLSEMQEFPCVDASDVPWSHVDLGDCLASAGKFEEALKEYEQAQVLGTIHGKMSTHGRAAAGRLARMHRELFQHEEAVGILQDS